MTKFEPNTSWENLLHIMHIAGALHGGPLTSIRQLARFQLQSGHSVTVVYSSVRDSGKEIRAELPQDVKIYPWVVGRDIKMSQDVIAFVQLTNLVRRLKPDILHLHSSKAGFHGRVVSSFLGVPSVYSPRGLSFLRSDVSARKRRMYRFLEFAAGRLAGPVVACSEDELLALKGVARDVRLIPNGIALSDEAVRAAELARLPGDGFRVALCGRISTPRAPRLVAEIAKNAPSHWKFDWIGDGELRYELEGSGVNVIGWLDRANALKALARCHVLLHPSLWEGMPNAVIEAMALGLPVVASDIVGNKSLVQHGVTGFLVSNPNGYLEALKFLERNPCLLKRLGDAGRQRVIDEFDSERLVVRWEQLYLETRRRL